MRDNITSVCSHRRPGVVYPDVTAKLLEAVDEVFGDRFFLS